MKNNISNAALKYRNKPVLRGLSYATVEDFVDSYDNLPHLATAAGDLKDVQRPWVFKTICSILPPGSRLIEVGAGEPLVASSLAQIGYDVTVIDPYDGSGNGPKEFEAYTKRYPELKFIRNTFTQDMNELQTASYDALYSISVIEHIPFPGIDALVAGCAQYLKTGGRQVHAIDFVASGLGENYHRKMLEYYLQKYMLTIKDIEDTINRALLDNETYFLSAESHNRWRGQTPYEKFPMRKVLSAHFVV